MRRAPSDARSIKRVKKFEKFAMAGALARVAACSGAPNPQDAERLAKQLEAAQLATLQWPADFGHAGVPTPVPIKDSMVPLPDPKSPVNAP